LGTIKLVIPPQHTQRVIDALSKSAGLDATAANAKKALIMHIKATVRNVEQSELEQAALDAIVDVDVAGIVEGS